ncbi:MAG: type II secretion system F family protein [Clostridia bacterium]|nr:type II secretion system F family protein [Clostridia bacterium]
MPEYQYRAVTKSGLLIKNRVEATSKQNLIRQLKNNEILPIHIEQVRFASKKKKKTKNRNENNIAEIMESASSTNIFQNNAKSTMSFKEKLRMSISKQEKITVRDISVFTQNFYLLKKANFNNIHALSTVIKSTENESFKGILEEILEGIESGEYIYTTMEYYSNIFPFLYINMIKVGELSGSLEKSLEQALKYLDENTVLMKKLKKIFVPNMIMLAAIIVLLVVGTLVAIPAIQNVYDSLGTTATLPAASLWFSNFLKVMSRIWYIPVLIIIGIVAIVVFYINTPKGKYNFHYIKYKFPLFGRLVFSIEFLRLMKAMLLNLKNGMRIQEALEVSKSVSKNYVMISIIETAINNIYMGGSWIEPFEKSGLPTPMMIEMLKIGMQTDLIQMLEKLLEYIEIDINATMDKIMKVLPEIIYLIVGAVLIFFVLVVLAPCIEVYMGAFLFDAV